MMVPCISLIHWVATTVETQSIYHFECMEDMYRGICEDSTKYNTSVLGKMLTNFARNTMLRKGS